MRRLYIDNEHVTGMFYDLTQHTEVICELSLVFITPTLHVR